MTLYIPKFPLAFSIYINVLSINDTQQCRRFQLLNPSWVHRCAYAITPHMLHRFAEGTAQTTSGAANTLSYQSPHPHPAFTIEQLLQTRRTSDHRRSCMEGNGAYHEQTINWSLLTVRQIDKIWTKRTTNSERWKVVMSMWNWKSNTHAKNGVRAWSSTNRFKLKRDFS